MACAAGDAGRQGPLDRVSPPAKMLGILAMAICISSFLTFVSAGLAFLGALALWGVSGVSVRTLGGRMREVNFYVLMLILFVPFSVGETPLFQIGAARWNIEGLMFAFLVSLKVNTIFLAVIALIGKLEATELGYTLQRLGVPEKFVQIFYFTIRYIDIMKKERQRITTAMRLRGYAPNASFHALRMTGYLIGSLLIRGINRSERVLQAMRCRGYRGVFYSDLSGHEYRADMLFGISIVLWVAFLWWVELTRPFQPWPMF